MHRNAFERQEQRIEHRCGAVYSTVHMHLSSLLLYIYTDVRLSINTA